jgi:hypothetical protein
VVLQQEVNFEVFKHVGSYSIKPLLTEPERRLANLPETLDFQIVDVKPVSSGVIKDGNLHVILDFVIKLRQQNLMA